MEQKRQLPRNVDGRIKIGPFPLINFLLFLIPAIPTVFLLFNFFSPIIFIIGILILLIESLPFIELQYKETGLQYIINMIRYLVKGDQVIERGVQVGITKRFIHNQKAREIRRK